MTTARPGDCGECFDALGNALPVRLNSAPTDELALLIGQRAEREALKLRRHRPTCHRCGKVSVLSPCRDCADDLQALRLPAPPGEVDPVCGHGKPVRGRETCEKGCQQ